VSSESYMPGGAGNVCSNLASLGAVVHAVSLIGADEASQRLLAALGAQGVRTEGVLTDSERPTTQKCRIIAEHQQIVRYDREDTRAIGSALQSRIATMVESLAKESDAIIISDYGKGVVAPAVLARALRAARKAGIPITVDP